MRLTTGFLALLVPFLVSPPSTLGQSGSADPALGVARLSVVNGDVATQRGDSGDSIAATVNMPLVEGDALQLKGASRAEIQLSRGNFVRASGDTGIQFLELATQRFRIHLSRGTAIYSELEDSEADIDIETPLVAVRPTKPGRYRVTVTPATTTVAVRQGETEVAFQDTTTTLSKGEAITVWKGPDGVEFEFGRAGSTDGFDKWAANRDKVLRRAISHTYLSRDIYGASTLDHHGSWRYVTGTGYCWFPRVSRAWVPYRHGRWLWIDYYGWTWVGSEPWGWAPYHWGRWHNHSLYGWGWFPGHPRLRHVWRPALVAFFGFEAAVAPRVWAGFGGIGWTPLAPGEPYSPWYGRRHYGNSSIFVDKSIHIYNTYRNARERHAVSYIDSRQFALGSSHTPRALRTGAIREAAAIRGPLPVVPDRASQGHVLRASSASPAPSNLRSLRRGYPSQLRDGTARISFDDQRKQMQTSVEAFYKGIRNRGATVASNSSVRARSGNAAPLAAPGQNPAIRPSVPVAAPTPANRPVPPLQAQRRASTVSTGSTQTAIQSSSTVRTRSSAPGATPTSGAPVLSGAAGAASGAGLDGTPTRVAPNAQTSARAASTNSRGTTSPPLARGRPSSTARIPERPGPSGQPQIHSRIPGVAYPPQSIPVPGSSVPTSPTTGARGPYPSSRVGAPASVYAPRTSSRIGTPSPTAGSRAGGTRPNASGTLPRASSRSGTAAPVAVTPTAPTVYRREAPSSGRRTRVEAPRPGSGSSTSVYAPRSRSRVGTYSPPGPSSRASSPSRSRTPSPSSRPSTRANSNFPRGSSRTGASRPSAPTVRAPRSSSRPSNRGGTFGNRGQRGSRSGGSSGGRISSRSSSRGSAAPRVGGLSTHRSSRGSSSGPRMSSPRPSSSGSRPSYGGSRPSYGGSGRSQARPSGSSRPASRAGPGARSSSSRTGKPSDR